MRRDSLFLASLVLAGGWTGACNADPAASRSSTSAPGLQDVYSATSSGLLEARRSVVTADADWTALWAKVTAHVSPSPSKPAVDLSQQSIIVAALGEKSSGGFTIHIDSIRAAAEGRDVFVTTTVPGSSCVTTGAMTQPVHIVTAPAGGGPTRFVETETTKDCGS
jgi:hypothetical protein